MEPQLRELIIDILTTLLEIFARSEKLTRKERFKQYLSVTFLNGNKKIADAKDRLHSLIEQETRLVGALAYAAAVDLGKAVGQNETMLQRTDKTSQRSEKKLEAIASSMTDSRRVTREKEERELLRKVLDERILERVREIHDDITERRLDGTGDWIQSETLFQQWMEGINRTLWILGGPGSGKSFLSSRIISHLQELHPPEHPSMSRASIGYFYIKEDDQQLRSANSLLKVVALQLATGDPVFRNYAAEVCRCPDKLGTARRTWENLFLNYFGSQQGRHSAAFVLIDGLDEAPRKERETFVQILLSLERSRLVDRKSCALQFALVGRPELRESISFIWGWQISFIEVSSLKNAPDVKNYVLKSIDRVKALKLRRIPVEERRALRRDIIHKLEDGANGMFLWVNLMLDQIYNTSRPSDIMSALATAPKNLDKMLRHVFERIASDPEVDKQDLNEILLWVACAKERLTLGEMDTILKLRPPLGEGMPDLEERLRGQFASFFTLSRKDNLTTEQLQLQIWDNRHDKNLRQDIHSLSILEDETHPDGYSEKEDLKDDKELFEELPTYDSPMDTTYIEFSHASVRDFLLQEGRNETRRWPADLGVGVDVKQAQCHITTVLLSVLCDQTHHTQFIENHLTKYAFSYSLDHLQLVDRLTSPTLDKLRIIRPLYTAFHDDSVLEQWLTTASEPYGLWSQGWLAEEKMNDCVREWLMDGAMDDHGFTIKESVDLEYAAKSTVFLFGPMAKFCARSWVGLGADDIDDDSNLRLYAWFLHFYSTSKDIYEGIPMPESIVSGNRGDLSGISLARLRFLANFGGFEKTALWYRNLAKALQDARYINAALENLFLSLQKYGEDWKTLDTVFCCYEDRRDCAKAIAWGERALAMIPDGPVEARSTCLRRLSYWYREVGDWDGAIYAATEAMVISPLSDSGPWLYISALDAASKYEEIIDVLGSPQDILHAAEGKGEAILSETLLYTDVQMTMCRAARKLGKSKTVIPKIQTLLESHQEAGSTAKPLRELTAIDILTDEYPENDSYGFDMLSQALRRAGEFEDANAAMAVCIAPLDQLKESRRVDRNAMEEANPKNAMEDHPQPFIAADPPQEIQRSPDQDRYRELIEDISSLDMEAQDEPSSISQIDFLFNVCDG
ncbi:MAG: hypothetical protein Q9222_002472 [Ikaeria aurantiellina]